jgi:CRISPR/Cas system endoribonuclease Cas6 (RAMP superfamily)
MLGWVGEIRLQGVTEELAVVLALAETCNAGSHAALGMGWFEWLPG